MNAIDWTVTSGLVPYRDAVAAMEARVAAIAAGRAPEWVWLLEHPPLYTAGTSAKSADLLDAQRFPVHPTGRGGEYTYHGPGQRVVYAMLDLNKRGRDIRRFVSDLEQIAIETLAAFGVEAERRAGRVGVWVLREDGREDKVAAIGIRVRHWISFHGLSLNVDPELKHYDGIVPCGIADHGVTSLRALGVDANMDAVDGVLRARFEARFGPTRDAPQPEACAALSA